MFVGIVQDLNWVMMSNNIKFIYILPAKLKCQWTAVIVLHLRTWLDVQINIISESQGGFNNKGSTPIALFVLIEQITDNADEVPDNHLGYPDQKFGSGTRIYVKNGKTTYVFTLSVSSKNSK